jgi:hypothetical protein
MIETSEFDRFTGVNAVRSRVQRRLTHNQRGNNMERVTLRIPKQQIEEVERMVDTGQFPNRSEAIRSAVREMINEQETEAGDKTRPWAKV